MSPSTPIVVCSRVSKQFGHGSSAQIAVADVDISLYPARLTMLAGPSGCGKTTLLSLMTGLLEPTAGHVAVLNQRLDRLSDHQRTLMRRRSMGFVTQHFNLLPMLTAAENVAVPLSISGWSKRRALEKSYALLEKLGIPHRSHALPQEMSGGEQQRVAVARALVHDPQLVVCDEPTSALDHANGRSVLESLKRLAQHPERAVLIVTHDQRMFDLADRTIRMDDGKVGED